MKIVFIGGVRYSLELLSHILKNNWSIEAMFSYDKSKMKFYSDYASFDEITKKYGIQNIKVQNINDSANLEILKKINPDLILVMGWSQLLKNELIKIPKLGVIGSHPTELPKYRGRAPIPWTIIKGLKESALTFFYISEGVDEGDILDQRKFKATDEDDAESLYEKIIELGKCMLLENLPLLEQGKGKRILQNNSKFIENWPKRTPSDGKIDWSKSAKEIHTLIRATTHPYLGVFTFFKNRKLTIWKSGYSNEESLGVGKIMDINEKGVKVGTGKGIVILTKVSVDDDYEKLSHDVFTKNDLGEIFK